MPGQKEKKPNTILWLEDQLEADKVQKKKKSDHDITVCQHYTLEQEMRETLLQKHRELISLRSQKKLLD